MTKHFTVSSPNRQYDDDDGDEQENDDDPKHASGGFSLQFLGVSGFPGNGSVCFADCRCHVLYDLVLKVHLLVRKKKSTKEQ